MLTKIAAITNFAMGCLWFAAQSWLWVMLGGIGGIHYSLRGFVYYSIFLLLFLAGPSCLLVGSWRTLSKQSTAVSMALNLVAVLAMAYFCVPVIYDALHPVPLQYVDLRFTLFISVSLLLTLLTSCYLAMQFLWDRRKMKKVKLDAG